MQSKHGSLEGVILTALWNLEKDGTYTNTVKDVYETLEAKRAYTTIKTVMDRLYEKNILIRYKHDKKFCYRTVYSNYEIVANSLNQLAIMYCQGDLEKLAKILNAQIKEKQPVNV